MKCCQTGKLHKASVSNLGREDELPLSNEDLKKGANFPWDYGNHSSEVIITVGHQPKAAENLQVASQLSPFRPQWPARSTVSGYISMERCTNTQTHVGKPSRKAATPSLNDGVAALCEDASPNCKRHHELERLWLLHCRRGRMLRTCHVYSTMVACSRKTFYSW